jgi:small nuclear ribonucleoprotein (snRNP)-like protein
MCESLLVDASMNLQTKESEKRVKTNETKNERKKEHKKVKKEISAKYSDSNILAGNLKSVSMFSFALASAVLTVTVTGETRFNPKSSNR